MKEKNWINAVSILALVAAGCSAVPSSPARPEASPTNIPHALVIDPPTIESPTLTTSGIRMPVKTETASWKIPDIKTWISWIKNPNFLKQFAKSQFKLTEYTTLDHQNQQEFASSDYPGNSCGETVLAMAINLINFYKTGIDPRTTNADIINELTENTALIKPNGPNMTDYNLKLAFDHFGQKDGLFSTVTLTPYCNGNCTSAIPGSEWSELFKSAQRNVLDKGGVLVAFVQEAGNPSVGHFIIIPSFDNGETVIMDPKNGSVRTIGLGAYTPSLLSLFGVVPPQ
jgi:hypothetical protein